MRNDAQVNYEKAYTSKENEILQKSLIVVSTCTGVCVHSAFDHEGSNAVKFTSVVVDEAAQASEPDVVLPALFAEQRVVVVGDHKQLGPVVPEHNLCRAYLDALERPLLERLDRAPEKPCCNTVLGKQYRMHPSIRCFPSKQFYSSSLVDDTSVTAHSLDIPTIWPRRDENVIFVDCCSPHEYGLVFEVGRARARDTSVLENNTSLMNSGEADLVVCAYQRLIKDASACPGDIAIITPYRAQHQEIRERLKKKYGEASRDCAIGTVYALQGSERPYIIISFVRSTAEGVALFHAGDQAGSRDIVVSESEKSLAVRQTCEGQLGIVSSSKLLNVSLTRAKTGLICVGNSTILSQGSNDFFDLCENLRKRDCLLSESQFLSLKKQSSSSVQQREGRKPCYRACQPEAISEQIQVPISSKPSCSSQQACTQFAERLSAEMANHAAQTHEKDHVECQHSAKRQVADEVISTTALHKQRRAASVSEQKSQRKTN